MTSCTYASQTQRFLRISVASGLGASSESVSSPKIDMLLLLHGFLSFCFLREVGYDQFFRPVLMVLEEVKKPKLYEKVQYLLYFGTFKKS